METNNLILTKGQQSALDNIKSFLATDSKVFILKGYAGTGKTTLLKCIISYLEENKNKYKLLATTGRAAKILSNITDSDATTIHSLIYTYKDFNADLETVLNQREKEKVDNTGQLFLQFELVSLNDSENNDAIYIIDESSMLSDKIDKNIQQAQFGSGRLLYDLLNYDRNGKFIFVGDNCQLPPISQNISPALDVEYFKDNFNINAHSAELKQIMRQSNENGIIKVSHKVRYLQQNFIQVKWGKLPFRGTNNIHLYKDSISLTNAYIDIIKEKGFNEATMLCNSNRLCNTISDIIRPSLGFNGRVQVGDLLLVTQNNLISGLMNGDMVIVNQILDIVENRANLTFLKVEVKELFSGKKYTQFLIENIINSGMLNISQPEQKELFIDFYKRARAKGVKQDSREFKELMSKDVYLNALRCVYGYALTCHKAQGGEWNNIFMYIPRNYTLNATPQTYQWVYTAMTRARIHLHVVDDFYLSY